MSASEGAKRYVMWDAHFLDGRLGADMYERFGSAGVTLFLAFVCGCKRNLVPGRIQYGSDLDMLAQLGLVGLNTVNEHGEPWTIDEFWTFLGQRKQTRRTTRGRLTNVISTRWAHWQKDWQTVKEREKKRRSRAQNGGDTGGTPEGQGRDTSGTETERETETESKPKTKSPPAVSDEARELTRELAIGIKANGHKIPAPETKAHATWLADMDKLLRIDGADPAEVRRVIVYATTNDFERANVQSPASFRKGYSRMRIRAQEKPRLTAVNGGAVGDAYFALADRLEAEGR